MPAKSKRAQRREARRVRGALRAALADRDTWQTMYFARLRELDALRARFDEQSRLLSRLHDAGAWVVTPGGIVVRA